MDLLSWIVLGLIVGIVGKLIMPRKDARGIMITIVIGIAGALLGGFISTGLGFGIVTGVNLWSLAIAVGGALCSSLATGWYVADSGHIGVRYALHD